MRRLSAAVKSGEAAGSAMALQHAASHRPPSLEEAGGRDREAEAECNRKCEAERLDWMPTSAGDGDSVAGAAAAIGRRQAIQQRKIYCHKKCLEEAASVFMLAEAAAAQKKEEQPMADGGGGKKYRKSKTRRNRKSKKMKSKKKKKTSKRRRRRTAPKSRK